MYEDFRPTMTFPSIESKVSHDLQEALSVPQEVLERLTGKDEIQKKIYDIVYAYGNYCRAKYQDDMTAAIASAVGTAMQPLIKQFVEKMLPPVYPIGKIASVKVVRDLSQQGNGADIDTFFGLGK